MPTYAQQCLVSQSKAFFTIKLMIIFIWSYFESIVLIVNMRAHIKIGSAYYEPFSTNIILFYIFIFAWNQERKTVSV